MRRVKVTTCGFDAVTRGEWSVLTSGDVTVTNNGDQVTVTESGAIYPVTSFTMVRQGRDRGTAMFDFDENAPLSPEVSEEVPDIGQTSEDASEAVPEKVSSEDGARGGTITVAGRTFTEGEVRALLEEIVRRESR